MKIGGEIYKHRRHERCRRDFAIPLGGSEWTAGHVGLLDFRLLDDGVPREVSLDTFDTGVAPISLVIAVQTSGISGPALVKIRQIGGMIQPVVIGSRGEAAVVAFDEDVAWRLEFTSDSGQLERALMDLHPGTF